MCMHSGSMDAFSVHRGVKERFKIELIYRDIKGLLHDYECRLRFDGLELRFG